VVPKSADEAARLRKILSRNYLFSELATGQLDNVVEVMKPLKFSGNEDVIRQGDIGKHLYVLVSGHCQAQLESLDIRSYIYHIWKTRFL